MKNARSLSFLPLLLLAFESNSQSVLGTSGGQGNAGSMNISYTAGEAFVTTLDSGSLLLTQGFHQPFYTVTAVEVSFPLTVISVFPNPTASVLQVRFKDVKLQDISISLFDAAGKSVLTAKAAANTWQTDLSGLPGGYYLLIVTDMANHKTNSFKIFKSN